MLHIRYCHLPHCRGHRHRDRPSRRPIMTCHLPHCRGHRHRDRPNRCPILTCHRSWTCGWPQYTSVPHSTWSQIASNPLNLCHRAASPSIPQAFSTNNECKKYTHSWETNEREHPPRRRVLANQFPYIHPKHSL